MISVEDISDGALECAAYENAESRGQGTSALRRWREFCSYLLDEDHVDRVRQQESSLRLFYPEAAAIARKWLSERDRALREFCNNELCPVWIQTGYPARNPPQVGRGSRSRYHNKECGKNAPQRKWRSRHGLVKNPSLAFTAFAHKLESPTYVAAGYHSWRRHHARPWELVRSVMAPELREAYDRAVLGGSSPRLALQKILDDQGGWTPEMQAALEARGSLSNQFEEHLAASPT